MKWISSEILKQRLVSPFLLAIPCTILIIILLPNLFPKYKSELIDQGLIDKLGGFEFWEDIDRDGNSERIVLFNNNDGKASIKIIEEDGYLGAHYYCRGEMFSKYPFLYFGAFNNEGDKLILVYSMINDSIFLNCIDHANLQDFLFRDLFIGKVKTPGSKDTRPGTLFWEDLDNDGWKEVIFTLQTGFPLQPRGCYVYNFREGKLTKSPDMGVYFGITAIEDVNQDDYKELFTKTYAISNYSDSLGGMKDDHSAWIMAFNNDLKFLFPPVEFRGKYIKIRSLPIKTSNEWYLVSLVYQLIPGTQQPRVILTNLQGKVIRERNLTDTLEKPDYDLFYLGEDREHIYITNKKGYFEKIDVSLQPKETYNLIEVTSSIFLELDLDGDGKMEYVTMDNFGYMPIVFRKDLSYPLPIDLPMSRESRFIRGKALENGKIAIFIQQADQYYVFSYDRNKLHFLKFPFYFGIYIFILGFIHLIRRLQRFQLEHRKKLSEEITALQLKSIKSQFDPHLTFNIMTSISYAVHQENKELAKQFIAKFSDFIRSIVTDSDKISRTLGRELMLISNYLDVEKIRLKHFEYVIKTPDKVNLSVEIPKNIVLTFVENAVKHGIRPKESSATIIVSVEIKADGNLEIFIEDDGVGRTESKDTGKENTGKGLLIVEQILDLWYKLYGKQITWAIEDLKTDNTSAGTRVKIIIP